MASSMYREIAEELRGQIEAGKLPPGGRLPDAAHRHRLSGGPESVRLRFRAGPVRDRILMAVLMIPTFGMYHPIGTDVPRRRTPLEAQTSG